MFIFDKKNKKNMDNLINTDSEIFYEEIKKQCKSRGMTVGELCEKADISRATLSNWKKKNPSSIDIIYKIQEVFNSKDDLKLFYCQANIGCKEQCAFCSIEEYKK